MPTNLQLQSLYRVCYQLTYLFLQPIYLVDIDEPTQNIFIIAGNNQQIELEITPNGEIS